MCTNRTRESAPFQPSLAKFDWFLNVVKNLEIYVVTFKTLALAAAFAASTALPASAVVTINVDEVGSDVVFTYSGSLDLTGLSVDFSSTGPYNSFGTTGFDSIASGAGYDIYNGLSGFSPISSNSYGTFNGIVSGDAFCAYSGYICVNAGYTSGDAINGQLLFSGQTLASLDLWSGSYSATIGQDEVVMTIGDVSAVPLPATGLMLMAGLGGLGLVRRRG